MVNGRDHPCNRRRVRSDDNDNENEKDPPAVVLLEDLLIKVFSWLPVKSLLMFKCLSKRWLHIISSDHYFIDLHCKQSKSQPSLLAFSSVKHRLVKNKNWATIFLQSSIDMEGNYLLNSKFKICRRNMENPGMNLIMLPTRLDLVCFKYVDKIYVCNPSTHESITLPPFSRHSDEVDNLGFGYVGSTNEYKIVELSAAFYDSDMEEHDPELPTECRVFTLAMQDESPSSYASPWDWKKIQNSPYNVELHHSPALVDGVVHWLINRKRHPEFLIDVNLSILAFSLEIEEFRILPRPSECRDLTNTIAVNVQLVELRGLLSFSCVQNDENKMGIWMLKDYYHHNFMWEKEYTIDLTTLTLLDPNFSFFRSDQPEYIHPRYRCYCVPRYIQEEENKILLEGVRCTDPRHSFYYDIQTAGFTEFLSKDNCRSFFSFYTESLRSLRYVLQQKSSLIKLDQVIGVTPSQSLQLANMDPPIYIIRIFAHFCSDIEVTACYGGYLTNLRGGFVAIEGKQIVARDAIETEVKAILRGLQFAREQGVQCIALVTGSKKMVDIINIPQERQTFQRLERIFDKITQLLSKFIWAQVFHDHGLSTQVSAQIAFNAPWDGDFCLNEPPKWFVDG